MGFKMYFPLNSAPAEPENVRSTGFAKQTKSTKISTIMWRRKMKIKKEVQFYLVVVVDLHPGLAPVARGLLGGLRVRHGRLYGRRGKL